MRKALIVGVDYYTALSKLTGCVHDAQSVSQMLEHHADGQINFTAPKLLTATAPHKMIKRNELREAIKDLFSDKSEIALFYFAGHGFVDETGGFLCASDCVDGNDGLPLSDIMTFARESKAINKIIILDSCHSGVVADRPGDKKIAEISDGMTLLTASTAEQYAHEGGNGAPGVFTNLLVDALNGAAANLVGDVSPGSVYAHIDQSLGPWGKQRPVFKTNVQSFVSLRRAVAPIAREELRQLATLFPTPGFEFPLDPTYEPERSADQLANSAIPPPDAAKNSVFRILQNYVRVNLVVPVGEPHMWHAAMNSKSCRLTVLGEHYRRLVAEKLI